MKQISELAEIMLIMQRSKRTHQVIFKIMLIMQRSREGSSASRPTVNEPFKHSASVRSYPDSRGAVVIKLKNRKSIFIDFFLA